MLDTKARNYIEKPILIFAKKLVEYNISANTLTLIGLSIGIIGSILYYLDVINYLLLLFIWLCGLIDVLDGKVANLTQITKFGTFLDIVTDRVLEFIFLFVIATKIQDYYYFFMLFGIFFISISVFLTSGIINNDRTNNKSFHYSTGITERTETFILITALICFPKVYKMLIIIFMILVVITIMQRCIEVYKHFGKN